MAIDKNQQNKKYIRIISIVMLAFLVLEIASGIIQHGLSKPLAYWIAAVIEAGLAYLTYNFQGRSRLVYGLLVLFAFAAPLTLFYSNVPVLKPAGSALWIYVMVSLAFNIYDPRVIKSSKSVSTNSQLIILQILSSLFIAGLAAGAIVTAVVMNRPGYHPVFVADDPVLAVEQITLGIMSVIIIVIGIFLTRIFKWHKRGERTFYEVQTVQIIRISLFESIGIFGFILGRLGGTWIEWMLMPIIATVAQVFIFPTQERLVSWLGSQNSVQ